MPVKVVHIALSNLVGHPISVVKALNKYTEFEARFVNLAKFDRGVYENDLIMPDDYEEILNLINEAEIIHFHHAMDLENNILNVNFNKLRKNGKILIVQWHSEPEHYKNWNMLGPKEIAASGVYHFVNGQYHERYYKNALIVPQIIKTNIIDKYYKPDFDWSESRLVYTPSNRYDLKQKRWATKGYSKFIKMINELNGEDNFEFEVIENKPNDYVLERKSRATIVADEIVTGSFHKSALEGLALGKPTFSYLDQRTAMTLAMISKTNELPLISTNSMQFSMVFKELVNNPELCKSIGIYSRDWMKKYYHESRLIKYIANLYGKILDNRISSVDLELSDVMGKDFLKITQFDLKYRVNNDVQL